MFEGSFFGDDDDRDERRSFNLTEKRAIWESQKCKCARCKTELNFFAAHFHHKKAWSKGGRTTVRNGMALCRNCHGDIHDEERLNKYKSQIKPAKRKKTATKKTAAKSPPKKKTAKKRRKSDDDDYPLFGGLFG